MAISSDDLTAHPQNTESGMFAEIERVMRLLIDATCEVLRAAGHTITEPMFTLIAERCLADARERYANACDEARNPDR